MRILLDMDGIVVDMAGEWLRVYNELFDDNLTKDKLTSWNFQDHVKPEAREHIKKIFRMPGFFDNMEPMPGAKRAIKRLKKMGHDVRIATSPASEDSARAKLAWCTKHLKLNWGKVFIIKDKHWLEADLLVDDKPANIYNWYEAKRPYAMAISWPYNKELADRVDCYAYGYKNPELAWDQILEAVERLSKSR